MTKKVQFFISSLSGGGAEKVLTLIAKEFLLNGYQVTIVSLEKRPQFYQVHDGIKLIKVNNSGKGKITELIKDYLAVLKYIRLNKDGINISFLSRCNLLSLIACIGTHSKTIICDRNNPRMEHSKLIFALSCQLYRFASHIVVQTEKIKSFYPGYLQKKIIIIENPLDFSEMERQLEGEAFQKENSIIAMGRLEPQKDFITIIHAFYQKRDVLTNWKLKIYGIGDMKQQLQDEIDRLNLNEQVFLCGRTDKPFLAMKKGRIFVLSSFYEGFPNTLCEAMYAELACAASDCVSGPSELITAGENGYLFDVGDEKALADILGRLAEDESLRNKLGEQAKITVKRLEMKKIFSKWENLILSCLKEK